MSGLIRLRAASDTRALRRHRNCGAGDAGTGLIRYCAGETSDRLTERERGETQCSHASHQDKENSLAHYAYPFLGTLDSLQKERWRLRVRLSQLQHRD